MSVGGDYQEYHKLYGTQPLGASPFASSPIAPGVISDPKDAMSAISGQTGYNAWKTGEDERLNRIGESGPFGSATYSKDANGNITRNYTGSNNQTRINNQIEDRDIGLGGIAQNTLGQVNQNYSNKFSFDGLPQAPGTQDFQGEAQSARDAAYGSFERRNEPVFAREKEEFQQQMADQGIPQGSPLYKRLQGEMGQRQSDARLNAQDQAFAAGGREHSRMFGLAGGARDRATGEYDFARNAPNRELASLIGNQRGFQNPQYGGISNIAVPGMNIGEMGLGYGELDQTGEIARMRDATERVGIAAQPDQFALARLRGEIQLGNGLAIAEANQAGELPDE